MLLCNLLYTFFLEKWASSRSEWAVCLDQDSFRLTEVNDVLLWQIWVVLDLVGGRYHLGLLQKCLEVLHTEVRHADGLDLTGLEDFLHLLPGTKRLAADRHRHAWNNLVLTPVATQCSLTMSARMTILCRGHESHQELWQKWVVAITIHWDWPMHEPQVNIVQTQ